MELIPVVFCWLFGILLGWHARGFLTFCRRRERTMRKASPRPVDEGCYISHDHAWGDRGRRGRLGWLLAPRG